MYILWMVRGLNKIFFVDGVLKFSGTDEMVFNRSRRPGVFCMISAYFQNTFLIRTSMEGCLCFNGFEISIFLNKQIDRE